MDSLMDNRTLSNRLSLIHADLAAQIKKLQLQMFCVEHAQKCLNNTDCDLKLFQCALTSENVPNVACAQLPVNVLRKPDHIKVEIPKTLAECEIENDLYPYIGFGHTHDDESTSLIPFRTLSHQELDGKPPYLFGANHDFMPLPDHSPTRALENGSDFESSLTEYSYSDSSDDLGYISQILKTVESQEFDGSLFTNAVARIPIYKTPEELLDDAGTKEYHKAQPPDQIQFDTETRNSLYADINMFENKSFNATELKNGIPKVLEKLRGFEQNVTRDMKDLTKRLDDVENDLSKIDTKLNLITTKDETDDDDHHGEVLIFDSFTSAINGATLLKYDGNPAKCFSEWKTQFTDLLELCDGITETQKLSRLKFYLYGRARQVLENGNYTTVEAALNALQTTFETGPVKILAKRALTMTYQAPAESVFAFYDRLEKKVQSAMVGEDKARIDQRMLEEFCDRLLPNLQYEVKAQRPDTCTKAYETATHLELLAPIKKAAETSVRPEIMELNEQIEALAIHQRSEREDYNSNLCYRCRERGHFARNCPTKLNRNHGDTCDRNQSDSPHDCYSRDTRGYDNHRYNDSYELRSDYEDRTSYSSNGRGPRYNYERDDSRSPSPMKRQEQGRIRFRSPTEMNFVS
ncbi:CBR-DCT-10 protein [Ditylenchus destructor]|nr:CBR-DCT-10 protein [Ditylenchus destructor]